VFNLLRIFDKASFLILAQDASLLDEPALALDDKRRFRKQSEWLGPE
jgi:hypothetical protein